MQICSNEFLGKFSKPNISKSPTASCSVLQVKYGLILNLEFKCYTLLFKDFRIENIWISLTVIVIAARWHLEIVDREIGRCEDKGNRISKHHELKSCFSGIPTQNASCNSLVSPDLNRCGSSQFYLKTGNGFIQNRKN